jgi:hypothetical protein
MSSIDQYPPKISMKNKIKRALHLILIGVCVNLSGCALAAIPLATGYMANNDKRDFHTVNLEREKAGLRPLSREEWKHQMNPGEVRRTSGDVAGLHTGGDVKKGETRPAYSQ